MGLVQAEPDIARLDFYCLVCFFGLTWFSGLVWFLTWLGLIFGLVFNNGYGIAA
jgi:hypothetical protein